MSTFGITARFPLGTYSGHRANGRPDDGPDPARLHAALVHSAYVGSTAVEEGGSLTASPAARTALEWFERNPPVGLQVPSMIRHTPDQVIAYRKEGMFSKEVGVWLDKTTARPTSDGWAVEDAFGWSWEGTVPADVRETLDALCADVACLGEAQIPVVLETGEVRPNWIHSPTASRFTPGGIRVRVASEGRLAELDAAHSAAHPAKRPSVSADKHMSMSGPVTHGVAGACLRERRYVSPLRPVTAAPWSHAILLFVDSLSTHADSATEGTDSGAAVRIPVDQRVDWAVALHRAIAKRVGQAAPPVITGRYEGADQPANRIAIQVLDGDLLAASSVAEVADGRTAIALLVPRDAANDDVTVLHQALSGFRSLVSRHGRAAITVHRSAVPCETFWNPPAAGLVRLWTPSGALVPEGRRGREGMTLDDAVVLSLSYVLRDLVPDFQGAARAERVSRLRTLGVRVCGTRLLAVDASRYVHRVPLGMVPQPVTTIIGLSGVTAGDRASALGLPEGTLLAAGQSRHLGGGLLLPMDMPAEAAAMLTGGSDA